MPKRLLTPLPTGQAVASRRPSRPSCLRPHCWCHLALGRWDSRLKVSHVLCGKPVQPRGPLAPSAVPWSARAGEVWAPRRAFRRRAHTACWEPLVATTLPPPPRSRSTSQELAGQRPPGQGALGQTLPSGEAEGWGWPCPRYPPRENGGKHGWQEAGRDPGSQRGERCRGRLAGGLHLCWEEREHASSAGLLKGRGPGNSQEHGRGEDWAQNGCLNPHLHSLCREAVWCQTPPHCPARGSPARCPCSLYGPTTGQAGEELCSCPSGDPSVSCHQVALQSLGSLCASWHLLQRGGTRLLQAVCPGPTAPGTSRLNPNDGTPAAQPQSELLSS